jgi:FkbM family methyltransferase
MNLQELIDDCINYIQTITDNVTISTSNVNLYEYTGLKLLHSLSQNNPGTIMLYIHSKGMVFSAYDKESRTELEMDLFRNTIINYSDVFRIFKENGNINKIGLFPSDIGAIWYNFFWVRANYLLDKEPPEINEDRFYYEHYIGFNGNHSDCYSLVNKSICYYPQPNVIVFITHPNQEYIDVKFKFDLLYFKDNYVFEYGTTESRINITDKVLNECLKYNNIYIPDTDTSRANIFGDPCPGILKSIFINGKEYPHYSKIYIESLSKIYVVDNVPTSLKMMNINYRWKKLKQKLLINYGTLNEECPEQLMAIRFIKGHEKVLEIGGNIGRNSLIIGSLLTDSKNLLTLESDTKTSIELIENRDSNNLKFNVVNAALSKNKLIQKGWDTLPSDDLLEGYSFVNTISFEDLKKEYPIDFDTLVLDCEGAFYYILQDFPEILNGINLIIMENDYNDISHKKYIDSVLKESGFNIIYTESGGWGPCYDFFYEVWSSGN